MVSEPVDSRWSSSMADFTSNWEEDPMYRLKNFEETESIKEYYEAFDSIQRCLALPEEFLLSWFVAGLREDTRIEVRSCRPRTVFQAYAYGRFYEIAYPKGRPLQSVPTQKTTTSLVSMSIPAVQEDDDHDLQLPQGSDQKFQEKLQELDRSNVLDSINMDATNSIEREEESEQEFVQHVFHESPRYDMMQNKDILYDGMSKNDDATVIDQDFVQIETKLEPILVKEPLDLDAYHLFDEMPEPENECVQLLSSIEKQDSNALKMIDEMPTQEATNLIEFIHNSRDDGGKILRISDIQSFVDLVGAMKNLVFDPGGRNLKRAPKEMMEDELEEFMLNDRGMGQPRGEMFLQPIISNFSYFSWELQDYVLVFDPGIAAWWNCCSLIFPCSSLKLLEWLLGLKPWRLQSLLACYVSFPIVQRIIWIIAWPIGCQLQVLVLVVAEDCIKLLEYVGMQEFLRPKIDSGERNRLHNFSEAAHYSNDRCAVGYMEALEQLSTQIPGEFAKDKKFPFDPGEVDYPLLVLGGHKQSLLGLRLTGSRSTTTILLEHKWMKKLADFW